MARTFPTVGISPIDVYNTQVRPSAYFEHVVTDDGTERHNVELVATPTMASGGNYVNLNITTTTAGTAATWVSSIYAKITQGNTKNVNGYFCVAELELVMGTGYNPSDHAVLILNYNSTNTSLANCSHPAYMYIRDYSSGDPMKNLFWFADAVSLGTVSSTKVVSTSADCAATHKIRCLVGVTPLWLLATTTAPA